MPRVTLPSLSINLGGLDSRNLSNDLNDQVNAAVESAVQDVFTQLSSYIASLFSGRRPRTPSVPDVPTAPTEPTTMSDLLASLVNENVQVTTPFNTLTGTVIAVEDDYIALVGTDGEVFLVVIDNIQAVSEL